MATLLHRLGKTAYRRWPFFIAGWLVLLIAVITVAAGFSKPMSDAFTIPGIPSEKAADLQSELFPGSADALDQASVTVVVAAEGYPGYARAGDVITGAEAEGILHAGTRRREDGAIVSAGGRVLSVVGTGPSLPAAREDAYRKLAGVHLAGSHHRSDIGLRAAQGEIATV